ncbi:hypothetical protein Barb6_02973 [Bacteroidales bacterium Barb6]|nr:hypothetical protein Barb6_02973 [Bacteroidales bacterium Barb6]
MPLHGVQGAKVVLRGAERSAARTAKALISATTAATVGRIIAVVSWVLLILEIIITIVLTVIAAHEYVEQVEPYDLVRPTMAKDEGHESEASGTLFGLYLTSYLTLNHNYYEKYNRDEHHYAIRRPEQTKANPSGDFNVAAYNVLVSDNTYEYEVDKAMQKTQPGTKSLTKWFVNHNFTNKDVFNNIFMIDREAFKGTKGLSGGLRMLPNLNYINDGAFENSDLGFAGFNGNQ